MSSLSQPKYRAESISNIDDAKASSAISNLIDIINDKNNLNSIVNELNKLNERLNEYDGRIPNLIDDIRLKLTADVKGKARKLLADILDNYDKTDRKGNPKYSLEDRNAIKVTVEKINTICDKTFIEKMFDFFSIGS